LLQRIKLTTIFSLVIGEDIMANLRKSLERTYMMTHTTGVTSQTPLGELERMYYVQYLAGSATITANTSLNDLKIKWMRRWLHNNTGTAPTQNFTSDLWKAMVASIGQRPVTSTATNIVNFWLNAT
jgi:hypothetical protein